MWWKKKSKKESSPLDDHYKQLIKHVIENLESNPDDFTALWFGDGMNKSIQNSNGKIHIMESGEILGVGDIKIPSLDKERIKCLIKPIFERDSKIVINRIIGLK